MLKGGSGRRMFGSHYWKQGGSSWTPQSLGANLTGWWDSASEVYTDSGRAFVRTSSQYLTVNSNASLTPTGDFAWSTWAYLPAGGVTQYIIHKGGTSGAQTYMIMQDTSNRIALTVGDGTSNPTSTTAAQSVGWHHIVLEYNSTEKRHNFTVDGTFVQNPVVLATTSANSNANALRFGAQSSVVASYFNGRMDATGFWHRKLTTDERAYLYNSGSGRKYSDLSADMKVNLISWWDFDEASGQANDSHGTNHATATNNPVRGGGIVPTVISDAVAVGNWKSKADVTKILTQGTYAARPLYSATGGPASKPCLVFDGTDDVLSLTISRSQPHSMWVLAKVGSIPAVTPYTLTDGASANRSRISVNASGNVEISAGVTATGGALTATEWKVIGATFSGTSSQIRVGEAAATTVSAGTNPSTALNLGSGASTQYGPWSVAEMVTADKVLSSTEQANLLAYFNQKYSLGMVL